MKQSQYRSQTEADYAQRLDLLKAAHEILSWEYEPDVLTLAYRCTYCPDFRVKLKDGTVEFHEVKGWTRDDAMIKLKVAAQMFQNTCFYLVKKDKRLGWKIKLVKTL